MVCMSDSAQLFAIHLPCRSAAKLLVDDTTCQCGALTRASAIAARLRVAGAMSRYCSRVPLLVVVAQRVGTSDEVSNSLGCGATRRSTALIISSYASPKASTTVMPSLKVSMLSVACRVWVMPELPVFNSTRVHAEAGLIRSAPTV